jgi:maleamate amidohydrolase
MTDPGQGSARPFWSDVFTEEERRTYEFYRRPERAAFPWASSALVVIDVTEEFLGERLPTVEAAAKLRTACGIPAWDAIAPIGRLIAAFRNAGRPVIYTKGFDGGRFGGAAIGRSDPNETSRIVADIAPIAGDVVIEKPRASAFLGTPMTAHMIRAGIDGLVVVGGTTSGCVRASTIEGSSLGFSMVLAHDGCFDRSPLSHAVALHELDVKYATVLGADDAIERLRGASSAPQAQA